ncbi:type III secretion inner membrane ring lipoprotein SctJ [Pseudomonas congelans]|uniref:Lipoprotein n=1 Tax=Pseudomonas syringae pv. syringae TaxID=321 RepID=C8BNW0_PSESY|nr:type III secretion inner membrane ring lipoprotein SctJ [Pseudomonas congelans]ACU65052.1 HrcJ [Pseudomonas syringae pv. syringae]MCF5165709.1 EscJ/YscJ/HrcJ family type III secretion inner membrane ring protein [Pseudomonas congelans]QVX14703.1 type III secretion inner membrane ring lipoprotein SctJ [Pseudomonas congelans]
MRHFLRHLGMIGLVLLLSACGDEIELHGKLSENDANDVIAELSSKHIEATKRSNKEGVSVLLSASDINRAVRVLEAAGLPRRTRTNLGEIFKKEGVISTPLEERARYIYALSQELEATLSQIDGVIVARVHVVLPERVAPGEPVQPASAAVFIKHAASLDPDTVLPRIRRMVSSSIPGMAGALDNTEKLSVVFVDAQAYQEQQVLVSFGPFLVPEQQLGSLKAWSVALAVGIFVLLAGLALWLRPALRHTLLGFLGKRSAPPAPGTDVVPAGERAT